MIAITAEQFDASGVLEFTPIGNGADRTYSRRVSRSATLDQGVAISDRGYSDGDITYTYRYKPVSKAHDETAKRLLRVHPTVLLFNSDGAFRAVIQSFQPSDDQNEITLLVSARLSEV